MRELAILFLVFGLSVIGISVYQINVVNVDVRGRPLEESTLNATYGDHGSNPTYSPPLETQVDEQELETAAIISPAR